MVAAVERIAELAGGAADVRIVVPMPSDRLSRWLSAEDRARQSGQDRLARSAGALTAAGLTVSGSVGDSDLVQAVGGRASLVRGRRGPRRLR